MDTYDIHTYHQPSEEGDDPYHPYILNVFPLGFEDVVGSTHPCFFTCGIHPWHSEDAEAQLSYLEEIAGDKRIVAIGECGMDKLKGPSMGVQISVFEKHIALSEKLRKPLIIHCVKAWDELIALYKKYSPSQAWIIHGFRGKPELTQQIAQHGFWFTVGAKFNPDGVKYIPIERMFCETDESELHIHEIYRLVAEAMEMNEDEFCVRIAENVHQLFPSMASCSDD